MEMIGKLMKKALSWETYIMRKKEERMKSFRRRENYENISVLTIEKLASLNS